MIGNRGSKVGGRRNKPGKGPQGSNHVHGISELRYTATPTAELAVNADTSQDAMVHIAHGVSTIHSMHSELAR